MCSSHNKIKFKKIRNTVYSKKEKNEKKKAWDTKTRDYNIGGEQKGLSRTMGKEISG